MPYKTILTYLSSVDGAQAVADIAVDLAEKHNAHVVGLHVVPWVPHQSVPRYPTPNDMLSAARKRLQAEADAIERTFADATKSISGRCEWRLQRAQNDNLVTHVLNHAMSADLIVASQEIDYPLDGVADSPSDLVVRGGRPVLIIPRQGQIQTVGDRIVIGWKPGREAPRAIFDSLPLLQRARTVHVVCVDEGRGETESASQLCDALARHGVETTEVLSVSSGAGETLLAQVEELQGDLLIMGCYGRWRLSELIFGGATRHVLKHMAVPVLMSH